MKAFNKDIVRSIRHSLGRFVAIAAIVALGCGFYAGLRMTAPDMKLAADALLRQHRSHGHPRRLYLGSHG